MRTALPLALVLGLAVQPVGTTFAGEEPGYRSLSFTQYTGSGGYAFRLPNTDAPVRIDVSARIDDKSMGACSMVMSALVTQDPYTRAISWIATDGDGKTHAGNTAAGDKAIVRIPAPDGSSYAVLTVDDAAKGRLKLVQKSAASGSKGYYTVTLHY